ncbi:MAG: lipid-binding protein [Halobacteriovoraceae bacterium]|nr:lipid-binding protein [Halobacteriovoraceae bacterium]
MMRKWSLLLVVSYFMSLNLQAANIDLKKSWLRWRAEKVTGFHEGPIKIKTASLKFEKGLIKKGTFIVDMDSLSSDDMEEGKWRNKLIGHLKSDDFFSVKKFKTAVLKINDSKKLPSGDLKVKGSLLIKGINKPVEFVAKKTGPGFKGDLVFNRTHYDIKYRSSSFFKNLGDKVIYDNVKLSFLIKLK